jgi:hypothetical protein
MKPQSPEISGETISQQTAGNRSAAELDEVNKTLRLRQRFSRGVLF